MSHVTCLVSENKDGKDILGNEIKKQEDEIKHLKKDILMFQATFTRMKQNIYDLRDENQQLKIINS